MTNYRAQYKLSQDAVRKYADNVRKLETELKEKERIIKNLKKVVGEVNREDKKGKSMITCIGYRGEK